MKERNRDYLRLAITRRQAMATVLLSSMLCVFGCGSDSTKTTTSAKYPTGISEDIEQQLKYDARVEGFETADNDSLVVNVNDSWMNSPPGMQERSVGQWYSLWHSSHTGAVVVQHQGNKVASWTSQSGYKPESKSKSDQPSSEG
jgi:hypothetical protein